MWCLLWCLQLVNIRLFMDETLRRTHPSNTAPNTMLGRTVNAKQAGANRRHKVGRATGQNSEQTSGRGNSISFTQLPRVRGLLPIVVRGIHWRHTCRTYTKKAISCWSFPFRSRHVRRPASPFTDNRTRKLNLIRSSIFLGNSSSG
jgi:hypothetical protein